MAAPLMTGDRSSEIRSASAEIRSIKPVGLALFGSGAYGRVRPNGFAFGSIE